MTTEEKLKQAQEKRDIVEGVVKEEMEKIKAEPREIGKADAVEEEGKQIEEKPREIVEENKGNEVDQTENKKVEVDKANTSKSTQVKKTSSMETKEKLEEVQQDKGVVEGMVKSMMKKIEEKSQENVFENKEKEVDQTKNKKDEIEKADAFKFTEVNITSSVATKKNLEEVQKDEGVVEGVVKDMKKHIEEKPRDIALENKGKEVDQTDTKKDEVKNVNISKCSEVEKCSPMTTKEKQEEIHKDKGVVDGAVKDEKDMTPGPSDNVLENKTTVADEIKVEDTDASKCSEVEKISSMTTKEKLEEVLKDEGVIVAEAVDEEEKNKVEAEPMEIVVGKKLKGETKNEVGSEEKENDQVGNVDASETGEVEKCSSLREVRNSLLELEEHEKNALAELRSKIESAIHEKQLLLKENEDLAVNKMKEENETSQERVDVEAKQKDGENEENKEHKKSKENVESKENNKDVAKVHPNINEDFTIWGVPLLPRKEDNATNVILLKFLKAKDFDANDAFEMLSNTLKWRKDNNIDSILDENFDEDLSSISVMDGVSREGHPVYYSSFKLFGNEELYNKVLGTEAKRNMFIRSRIQLMERAIQKLNFKPGGVSSIFLDNDCRDMPGPSKKELRIALKHTLSLHQDHYPEFVARHIFINVPFWYYAFGASTFLSPFLTPKSHSKYIFARPAKAHDALLRYIALEKVPVHYGGFRKENDPDFSIKHVISEIFLNPSSTETIHIPIQAEVSSMWEVLVSGWEVHYTAEFIPTDEGSYTVIIEGRKKISGHEGPIRNSFTSKEPGNIVLTVENGALIKKKRILYRYKMMNQSSS